MGFYNRVMVPRLVSLAMRSRQLGPYRERVVSAARGRVLEFGLGPGYNLDYYDSVESVIGVEPDATLRRQAAPRGEAVPFPVEIIDGSASALPFEADDFDTVVTTWTLCTIPDGDAALAEARRVLRPGGRLLFVEHGRSPDAGVAKWQDRLNRVWPRLAGGCNLNRDIAGMIERAGFSLEKLDTGYAKGPRPMTFMYEGSAIPR